MSDTPTWPTDKQLAKVSKELKSLVVKRDGWEVVAWIRYLQYKAEKCDGQILGQARAKLFHKAIKYLTGKR